MAECFMVRFLNFSKLQKEIKMGRKGFTLIELLVVIAIIALILAILIPTLGKAKKLAQRVTCKTNMHQYGLAIFAYASDNQNRFMETVYSGSWAKGLHPEIISTTPESSKDNYWNLNRINPYIHDFDFEAGGKGVFVCPGTSEEFYMKFSKSWYESSNHKFTQTCYSYFGGVDNWDKSLNSPQNGAENDLAKARGGGGQKLIMSDQIMVMDPGAAGYSDQGFRYNHGIKKWSWNWDSDYTYPVDGSKYRASRHRARYDAGPVPEIAGINKLFDDGSVDWKKRNEFDLQNMNFGFPLAGYRDGWVKAGNRAFYY